MAGINRPVGGDSMESDEFIGYVGGYLVTTDVDSQGDKLTPEVVEQFAEQLRENPAKRTLFLSHDTTQPTGYITEFHIQTKGTWKGLYAKVGIYKSRPDVWKMIESGQLTGFSYGGRILRMEEHMSINDDACSFSVEVRGIDWHIVKDTLAKMGGSIEVTVRKAADFPTIINVTASVATIAGLIFQLYTINKRSGRPKSAGHSIIISISTKKFNFEDNTVEEIATMIEANLGKGQPSPESGRGTEAEK
jgi:hypothetical protein